MGLPLNLNNLFFLMIQSTVLGSFFYLAVMSQMIQKYLSSYYDNLSISKEITDVVTTLGFVVFWSRRRIKLSQSCHDVVFST